MSLWTQIKIVLHLRLDVWFCLKFAIRKWAGILHYSWIRCFVSVSENFKRLEIPCYPGHHLFTSAVAQRGYYGHLLWPASYKAPPIVVTGVHTSQCNQYIVIRSQRYGSRYYIELWKAHYNLRLLFLSV